jgi:serine/threonine protein kinase/tetratricopeptide (TPR) repeat protein
MALTAGTRLGPYEILALIGRGGMGEVYKAWDTRLGRNVAIKHLKSPHGERFEREAHAVAALNHPNICQIYDIGPDYLVLEHIEGKPPHGPLPVEQAVRLALQIASALEEAHGLGILHRDLKPTNILVTAKGTAKLLDFGLAKFADVLDPNVTKTLDGTLMGTAAYMSPEQAQGKTVDERSDVFSFGAVLYELLSGRRAFSGESFAEILSAVMRDTPAPLESPLAGIVSRCLAKATAQRFANMSEVRAELQKIALAKPADQQTSIAVLPFANMSRNADEEYFSDGLAEEILNLLTHIRGLKVIARTSSFAFRGKEQDITGIAAALKVKTILEGSVRRAGDRVRITAQLISGDDGSHLWSERYDREMTDIFVVQDEIATAIAQALELKLAPEPHRAPRHQPNLPAYEAYLKGMHEMYRVSPESLGRAEGYFQQAAALDPQWAEPHSQVGFSYLAAGLFGLRPMLGMTPLARAEARKALELSPSDAMGHALLGALAAVVDYDWKEEEEEFRLAKASEPVPPGVRVIYALCYLSPLGRYEEALRELDQLIAVDPLDPVTRRTRAWVHFCGGTWDRAIDDAKEAVALGEHSHQPYVYMALSSFCLGNLGEAQTYAEEALRIAPWSDPVRAALAGILAQIGDQEGAARLLQKCVDNPVAMFSYHLLCSETEAAIDCCEKWIERRYPVAPFLGFAAPYKALRESPRWPKLAKMMNLPGTGS